MIDLFYHFCYWKLIFKKKEKMISKQHYFPNKCDLWQCLNCNPTWKTEAGGSYPQAE